MPKAAGRPRKEKPEGSGEVSHVPIARFAGTKPARVVVYWCDGESCEYVVKSYSLANGVMTLVTKTGERLLNWPMIQEIEVVDL